VDLDCDGIPDILSGSWPGQLYFFKGKGKGQFEKGEKIKDRDGKEIKLESASTVCAVDWNGDGLLDLLVGDIQGHVWFIPNEGTAKKPAFGSARKLEADGKVIKVESDSHPVAADWDSDGHLDLIVGSGNGSVLWYRNIGTNKEPKLAAGKVLIPESKVANNEPGKPKKEGCGQRTKVCVVDWNGDGRLDLLVGDFGYTQGEPPRLTEEEAKAAEKAQADYSKLIEKHQPLLQEQAKLSNPPDKETPEAKAEREKQLKEIEKKLKSFQDESQKLIAVITKGQPKIEWHGNVWLFLRKPAKEAKATR
jgi:hypothetical protein